MQIKFITSNGFYQKGDIADLTPGLAYQCIREGRAVEYVSPNQMSVAELRAIANRRKPVAATGSRKLSRAEIRALCRRSVRGVLPYAEREIPLDKTKLTNTNRTHYERQ